ncbi:MAG: PilZ domain-containing protein [Gammaproteobacteria bacterium]
MFKLFQREKNQETEPVQSISGLRHGELIEIMRRFPIGYKVRSQLTYQQDLEHESIIIAYMINDRIIYSQKDIQQINKDNEKVFSITVDGKKSFIRDVRSFAFILPSQQDINVKASTKRLGNFGKVRQFRPGNHLTLTTINKSQGCWRINTAVKKSAILEKGYYKNQRISVVEIIEDTIAYTDQRQHERIKTEAPASLQLARESEPQKCLVNDFSEQSVRISFEEGSPIERAISIGRSIFLTIAIEEEDKAFIIEGHIIRKNQNTAVIELNSLLKENEFVEMELLDSLDFKASMLKHPKTALSEED